MNAPAPIPTAVADLKVAQMPQHVRDAVTGRADAQRAFRLCRGPLTAEARETAIADMARADKTLATVPQRIGGAS